MMSYIRDFAYIFVTSKKANNFGFLTKIISSGWLILSLSLPYIVPGVRLSPAQTVAAVLYGLTLLSYLAGPRRVFGMAKLLALFVVLGLFLDIISVALGSEPSNPLEVSLRAMRVFAIVVSLSTAFQLFTITEMRYLLTILGLRSYSELFSAAMAQLPATFIAFSESYVATKSKLGGRKIAALIKPLVVDSIVSSRYLAEALYMHGIPPAPKPKLLNMPRDLAMIVSVITITVLPLLSI